MLLIFRACFGASAGLAGNGERLGRGREFVFQFPKRFFAGTFCDLKAVQLFGQLFFVRAQTCDLACQNIGPPLHRFLLSSNICAALVHVGDPALGLASAFLPSPDFGKRDCTAFARLGNALLKRRQIRLIARQQLARSFVRDDEFLDKTRMMRAIWQRGTGGFCCGLFGLCFGKLLFAGRHTVEQRGLCRFKPGQRIFRLVHCAQSLPQLPFGFCARRRRRPNSVLRGADSVRHLRKRLSLFSQSCFCWRYQCIQFGQSVCPNQQLSGRCAIAIGGETIPAAQLPGKRHHALTRFQRSAIVLFDNPHMGKACSQFLRCIDIMDQGIVCQSVHRGRPAQPTASGIPANRGIGIITQRSGQRAFVAGPNLDAVNRLVAVPFGK